MSRIARFLAEVNAVVLRRLAGAAPAFTAVIVKGLASPELLMEVDIVAIIRKTPDDLLYGRALRPHRHARSGRHDVLDRGRLALRLRAAPASERR